MKHQLLKDKKGLIFGVFDKRSIAWAVAEQIHANGGVFILSNTVAAIKMGDIGKLALITESQIIPADATNEQDLNNLIDQTLIILGGKIDFVLHSIGMSINLRKGRVYYNQKYSFTSKGWEVSALSFHKLMQTLYKLDAMNKWGSIIALTFMAAQRPFSGYDDMADNKAYLESVARSFGHIFGNNKQVRVNTISQSPTVTTAGSGVKGIENFITFTEKMSPLGNATALDCAYYVVTLFSDYTRMVTMQNLFHDGGFSKIGVSDEIMTILNQNEVEKI
jgi:enoyl-[acyl-carrier protein] reductase I